MTREQALLRAFNQAYYAQRHGRNEHGYPTPCRIFDNFYIIRIRLQDALQ